MKKKFSFLISVFISANLTAQIPNAGFDNWTNMGTYSNPNGWGTMNNITADSSIYTVNMGTNQDSTHFIKVTSRKIGNIVLRGVAVSGVLDTVSLIPKSGFAFNQQPDSLIGKWSHMGYGGDPGMITVVLTRWNSSAGKRDTVAYAYDTLIGMQMVFAPFGMKLNYVNPNQPDSCIIYMAASGNIAKNNDYLFVDSLAFTGNASGIISHSALLENLSVFPNPSAGIINLSFTAKEEEKISVQVTSPEGKIIWEKNLAGLPKGENGLSFNILGIAKGSYFINIVSDKGIESKKILIGQ